MGTTPTGCGHGPGTRAARHEYVKLTGVTGATRAPAPTLLVEVSPSSQWCQRWGSRAHTWQHRAAGGFDPAAYAVEPLSEAVAKDYVTTHHYSASYPAAQHRFGLFAASQPASGDPGRLLGVAVFGVPMSAAVLTNTFPDLEAMVASVELSRLVLADAVPANGESWFLARCFDALAIIGVRGVLTFADPVPRLVGGQLLFPGHVGIIYQASNAHYCGRATARTLTVLPDGRVLSDRSAQKVRSQDRGHDHVERTLVALGATAPPALAPGGGARWLAGALDDVGAVRIRHRGNHRYAFALGTRQERRRLTVVGASGPYPKARG